VGAAAVLLTLTAVFSLLLIWDTLPSELLFFFAMVLRMSILGAYAALLVVTAEVFPTKIRATGVGLCGAVARVAGIITPFVAEVSVNDSYVVPLAVYSGTALLAAVVAMLLPYETAGLGTFACAYARAKPNVDVSRSDSHGGRSAHAQGRRRRPRPRQDARRRWQRRRAAGSPQLSGSRIVCVCSCCTTLFNTPRPERPAPARTAGASCAAATSGEARQS
jgi:MFS family permease